MVDVDQAVLVTCAGWGRTTRSGEIGVQLTTVTGSVSSDVLVSALPHIFWGPSRGNRQTLLEVLDRQVGDDAEMV